jgi:hypothetical protein
METKPDSTALNGRWPPLPILDNGQCEPLKAVVHGVAFGLTALMGAYNAAAWLRRRQRHLAINAVIYLTAMIWEQRHVANHLATCLAAARCKPTVVAPSDEPADTLKVA